MNYTIEEYLLDEHNAASKARRDVSLFILQNGFQSLFKNDKTKMRHNKWAKLLLTIQLCARLLMIGKEDILFIQTSLIVLRPILIIKAIKKFKVIYLIHDLYCLRYNTEHSIKEHSEEIRRDISLISQCDGVIAHNKSMVQKLKDFGCTSKLASLEVFDYDCPFPAKTRTLSVDEKPKVVFAGYLGKAEFLKKLDDASHENYELVIYGIPKIEVNHSFYKGSIDAELLPSVIEGHFGLI